MSAYGPEEFARDADVSRETLARLKAYVALLETWNRKINLVGRSTMADVWHRHILDSAQIAPLIQAGAKTLVDLGTGAGLPGLILSVLNSPLAVHLVESDSRKCAFLREAVRVTQSPAIVHESRIERVSLPAPDVIVARACASLSDLLDLAENLLSIHTTCIFLKGAQAEQELTVARTRWKMQLRQVQSRTDPLGRILVMTEVARV